MKISITSITILKSLIITFITLLILLSFTTSSKISVIMKSLSMQDTNKFLRVKSSSIGDYITDKNGRAIYLFQNDQPNKSNCVGECEKRFIPFIAGDVTFPPEVADRLDQTLVGIHKRPDEKYQVTYNKIPLYFFVDDMSPDDTKGHRIKEFGGLWSLIKPDGTPLDSRIGMTIDKMITANEKMTVTATGLSSILLTPDTFAVKMNITENILNMINLNQTVNSNQIGVITKYYEANKTNLEILVISKDFDQIEKVVKLLKDNSVNYNINYSVSGDTISNANTLLYTNALKDAQDNANILVDPFGLNVDKDYPVKSLEINADDLEKTTPLTNMNNFYLLPIRIGAVMLNLKANVEFNLIKK